MLRYVLFVLFEFILYDVLHMYNLGHEITLVDKLSVKKIFRMAMMFDKRRAEIYKLENTMKKKNTSLDLFEL